MDCNFWNKIKPFLHKLFLAKGIYHRNRNLPNTGEMPGSCEPQFEVNCHVSQELFLCSFHTVPLASSVENVGMKTVHYVFTGLEHSHAQRALTMAVPVPGWELNKLSPPPPKKKKPDKKAKQAGWKINLWPLPKCCHLVAARKHGDRQQAESKLLHNGKDLIDGYLPRTSFRLTVLWLYASISPKK